MIYKIIILLAYNYKDIKENLNLNKLKENKIISNYIF